MAINVNREIVQRINPLTVPTAPGPIADQSAGLISSALKNFFSTRDAGKKQQREIQAEDFKNARILAEIEKMKQESSLDKAKLDAFNQLYGGSAGGQAGTPPTPISAANPSAARLAEIEAADNPHAPQPAAPSHPHRPCRRRRRLAIHGRIGRNLFVVDAGYPSCQSPDPGARPVPGSAWRRPRSRLRLRP